MTISAPAKINLSLCITRKRDDGFHELETLVLPLPGLTDTLEIIPAESYFLHCDTPGVPTDESNLVSKALRIFEKETGKSCNFRINLTKNVPHGAGLGGGSADAAYTLLALNGLIQAKVPLEKLADWAGQLGSDIPLFLYQSPCWCRGRGEIIKPVDLDWNRDILLFKPTFSIPTPWAYSRWKDSREIPGIPYGPQSVDGQTLFNDLERPVFEKYRFLAELKLFLLEQPETIAAMMSGSGSTVFAILEKNTDHKALTARARAELDPKMWHHFCPADFTE